MRLFKRAPGTGLETWEPGSLGRGTWDLGAGTWDGTWDWELGPGSWDLGGTFGKLFGMFGEFSSRCFASCSRSPPYVEERYTRR